MKPRDQTREDEKLRGPSRKSVESCGTRSYIQFGEKLMTRAHMQKGEGSRRLRNRHQAKQAVGWAEVGLGRPTQAGRPSPFQGPVDPPLTKPPFGLFIAPRPRAMHQLIRHRPPRSREERDTISERRGSS
jgi:hypothetical protein